mmetsp:Transcript_29404/g.68349  ORF Transcript_29404/g.68349 Transcript_29404/m.68349 type:complete len:159 (+) Transcript_29404:218-694(+)
MQMRAHQLDEVHFVTALHRIAKSSILRSAQANVGLTQILNRLDAFVLSMTSRHLANTLWAVARLNFGHEPLRDALAASAITPITDFKPPELASTAWSCAALRCRNTPLCAAIASAAIARINDFDPQGLSGTAWSVALLSVQHQPLRSALSSAALRRSS